MALWRSMGARKDATRGTTALEVRKAWAALLTGPGVLPGATSPLVTGTAGWAYSVGVAAFASQRAVGDGLHLFGNDGAVTIGATGVGSTVPAAPSSGLQRIDIIWVIQKSASENADGTAAGVSDPTFGVTSGTAAAGALPPTIPAGALELARNLMTSEATSTASTGNTITQTATGASLVVALSQQVSSSLAPTTGASGADLFHASAGVSLGPGTWDITAQASVDASAGSATAAVAVSVGASTSALAGSFGPAGTVSTTQRAALFSATVRVVVSSTTSYYVLAAQSGGAALRMSSLGNSPAAWICANKVA